MRVSKYVLAFLFLILILGMQIDVAHAQCAMCKAAIENNPEASNYATGLNRGILYLMTIPYLIFGVIGYFWYKNSKGRIVAKS